MYIEYDETGIIRQFTTGEPPKDVCPVCFWDDNRHEPSCSKCERTKPSDQSPVPHDYEEAGEDYGSLGDGGSYYRLKCKNCGRIAYSPMPD